MHPARTSFYFVSWKPRCSLPTILPLFIPQILLRSIPNASSKTITCKTPALQGLIGIYSAWHFDPTSSIYYNSCYKNMPLIWIIHRHVRREMDDPQAKQMRVSLSKYAMQRIDRTSPRPEFLQEASARPWYFCSCLMMFVKYAARGEHLAVGLWGTRVRTSAHACRTRRDRSTEGRCVV
jgi:hypothetical protein